MSDSYQDAISGHERAADLDKRIEAIKENLRDLIEQAAGYSGASDDDLASERISQQEEQLALLMKEREEIDRG